ncbi:hypothetical protein BDF22DRAFT_671432 [Syncephalis plumigaleata]|nr:hypothetical protein BDF22DRAFT_671432 [Syncephalis plumigaleata]
MNVIKEINRINTLELDHGIEGRGSWHDQYKDSAYVYIGGLPFELSEGDVICIFSQYGEVMDINLMRDQKTGKSRGFCFLKYDDQRSTILAVDNLNGAQILGRTIRVDHIEKYKRPKTKEGKANPENEDEAMNCAPQPIEGPSDSEDSDEANNSEAELMAQIDPEDPMAEFLLEKLRKKRAKEKKKAEKAERKAKKNKKDKKDKKERKEKRETEEEERGRTKDANDAVVERQSKEQQYNNDRDNVERRRSRSRSPTAAAGYESSRRYRRHSRSRSRSPAHRNSRRDYNYRSSYKRRHSRDRNNY